MNKNKIKEVLDMVVTPQDLALKKATAYKEYVLSILANVTELVKNTKSKMPEKELKELLFYSPAGDFMGLDNYVINFGVSGVADLQEALKYMTNMFRFAQGEIELKNFREGQI